MVAIGQIVYNLEDFVNSGGYISTIDNDISQTIVSTNPNYNNLKIDIFSDNILNKVKTSKFTQLGVQAPQGTKMIINNTKTIMVGRTGVYELNDEIDITSLKFIRPYKYILDELSTEQYLSDGISGFTSAEENRQTSLDSLNKEYENKPKDENYWVQYTNIQTAYIEEYNLALSNYLKGVNGVYALPNPDNPESEENFEEVYNIIIDFLY